MTSSHTDKSLADKVTAMKRAHLDDGSASVALRQDRLQRAADLLANHHTELVEAISADYGHRSQPSLGKPCAGDPPNWPEPESC